MLHDIPSAVRLESEALHARPDSATLHNTHPLAGPLFLMLQAAPRWQPLVYGERPVFQVAPRPGGSGDSPLRLVVVYHVTWLVKQTPHRHGLRYRNFDSPDLSRNCWWASHPSLS